jgi:hypothetical protein
MNRFVVVAALGLLLTGCAGRDCQQCAAPINPVGVDVTATEKDQAVTMRAGQKLEVVLHAPQGMGRWTHPQSNDASVLLPIVDPAATSARDVTIAAFEAKKTGVAQVSATASPQCASGQACPMLIALYSLKVTVTP